MSRPAARFARFTSSSIARSAASSTAELGDTMLAALADLVDAGLSLAPGEPARLVRVRAAPADGLAGDELEVGFRPVEAGGHPLDELVGFRAPSDWAAIGVAATGRATSLDGGDPFPVRSVHLVARTGAWASCWRPISDPDRLPFDGGLERGTSSSATSPPTGRVDDALRRSLGLPTAPPPGDTGVLWTAQWLDALLVAAARGSSGRRRRRPLAALVAAHPAVRAFDLDPATIDVERLIAEGARLATWRDWPRLRRACAAGSWSSPELDAATASWLDDGAFARWVLGGWPELVDLHVALGGLLAPSAMSVIDDALAGWDLLDALERRPAGPTVTGTDGSGQ